MRRWIGWVCAAALLAGGCRAPDKGALFARHPNLHRMYDAVLSRPEIKAVWTRNGE